MIYKLTVRISESDSNYAYQHRLRETEITGKGIVTYGADKEKLIDSAIDTLELYLEMSDREYDELDDLRGTSDLELKLNDYLAYRFDDDANEENFVKCEDITEDFREAIISRVNDGKISGEDLMSKFPDYFSTAVERLFVSAVREGDFSDEALVDEFEYDYER